MNRVQRLETLLAVTGDINVELNKRTPKQRPLLSVVEKRANLRVHSVDPIITTHYGQRASDALVLNGEYPLAALQVREGLRRGEACFIAGILAVERTMTELSGYVGVIIEPDDLYGTTNLILGPDRTPDVLSI